MKLLTLCKRQPQGRDMLARPYGRFHHLPGNLAAAGIEILQVFVGFRGDAPVHDLHDDMQRIACDVSLLSGIPQLSAIEGIARDFAPDWIAGFSDTWCGWLAHHLAKRTGSRLWIDAYDNYEAYMPWNLLLHALWRRAVRDADLVTAAGPQLAEKLSASHIDGAGVHVLPMAADPGFVPMDRAECRSRLQLPQDVPLLGYFGGWTRSRGSDLLLQMLRRVRMQNPDVRLVVSGRPPAVAMREPGVLALGYIEDALLPVAVNAVDVACVVTANTPFGRYSYPAKLCEAIACSVPLVASDSEPVRWMLGGDTRFLARVGDPAAFAERVLTNLAMGRVAYPSMPDWPGVSRDLESLLARHNRA